MKNASITLKGIAFFMVLSWIFIPPCMADEKPSNPPSPIVIEGEYEDERDRSLILPLEAWTTSNELGIIFYKSIPNVTISIMGNSGILESHSGSFEDSQRIIIDISNYVNGSYSLIITTTQGTYLTGVFEINR